MAIDEIVVLIISAILGIGIVLLLKLIMKDKFKPILWMITVSFALGYTLMWFTSESDTILLMLKDVLVWTFIILMIYVNVKCLVRGTKSRTKNGKSFWKDIKAEYKNVANTFKKKPKEDNGESDNGGDNK